MSYPRVLLAAGSSGSGKTLITCGILQALCERGMKAASFKCGPDYIDPMFHSRVLGTKSRNLDTFFTNKETTRYLFCKTAAEADISVMEGVMGYYDGLGGVSAQASAYDLARVTDTPTVLIVNCKGMSLSVLAYLKGYLEYRPDSRIRGVIFNQLSPMLYPQISKLAEEELGVRSFGYVPVMKELKLESRHLGLVMPDEIDGLRENLHKLAGVLEETLDLSGMIELARSAPDLTGQPPEYHVCQGSPVIAVARDEAFCFLYEDNLDLLERMGAKLKFFSPLRDQELPADADGLAAVRRISASCMQKNSAGMFPCGRASAGRCREECPVWLSAAVLCTGQQEMEDMDGHTYPVVGAVSGRAYRTQTARAISAISC